MEPVRLAVVGVGAMGATHAERVRACPACVLVGVCDTDPAREAVAARLGVPFYPCVGALIEQARPAGAIIATPTGEHAATALACLRRSVHVLIEKPIATSLAEAEDLRRAAAAAGARILVGHHRRHSVLVRTARDLVRNGSLGRLVGVSVLWSVLKPDEYYTVGWRREPLAGGPVLINLVHDLDSLRFICGEITEVYAHTRAAVRRLEVEDAVSIALTFDNGAVGTLLAADTCPSPWSYEANAGENRALFHAEQSCYHFLGTAGALAFPMLELWRYPDGAATGWQQPLEKVRLEVTANDPLQDQLEHFCRVVGGTEAPVLDAAGAARSLAVALAIQTSAREGKPVAPASVDLPS